jgi:hypothetical protein
MADQSTGASGAESLIDNLGITSESIVAMSGLIGADEDGSIQRAIHARAKHAKDGTIEPESNVIFMRVGHVLELSALKRLQKSMRRDAVVWVLWPNNKPTLTEADVRKAATEAELESQHVVPFSDTYSAVKLVVPNGTC